MAANLETYQKQIQELLAHRQFSEAVDVWMKAADEIPDRPEVLLLLAKEFLEAGASGEAADLISLVIPSLRQKGEWSELLWALKLLARLQLDAKDLRQQLIEAYRKNFDSDPRLQCILACSGLLEPSANLADSIALADTLLALKEGSYCEHKSWGFGRVVAFDPALAVIRVDFKNKPSHPLQMRYATESLTPLPADHVAVLKAENPDRLKRTAVEDPVSLLRLTLHSLGRSATAEQLESVLCPEIIPSDQWKRWWDNAKKLIRRDPHFAVPSKKSEPIVLREIPVSVQEELLQAFQNARGLKARMAVAQELLKLVDEIDDPELLVQEFFCGLQEAIHQATAAERSYLMEATLICDELRKHQKTPASTEFLSPLKEILKRPDAVVEQLESLPVAWHTRAVELSRSLLGEQWSERFLQILPRLSKRLIDEVARQLVSHGEGARLAETVRHAISAQSATAELLLWLCQVRTEPRLRELLGPLWNQRFFVAVLTALDAEKTRAAPARHASRLLEFVLADKEIIADLLKTASPEDVKDAARALLASPALDELSKRSLMARIIKLQPELQQLLLGRDSKKAETLIVSWPSFMRRRSELEEIINKKLPENSRVIAQARSYGDLSENFEYKAAKEVQRFLQRRRAELERALDCARPTYFEDAPTDRVGIGSRVTVTGDDGEQKTFHILGAWDSDPQRGVISYLAPLAQSLLNKKIGDDVEVEVENRRLRLRILNITKTPKEFLESL